MKSILLLVMLVLASTETSSAEQDSSIVVSFAVPHRGDQRVIEYSAHGPHFHVIISNTSDKPQRMWRETCSWGYDGLSFEFTDATGKTWIARKKSIAWTKNYPEFWSVGARESLVLDVHFADTKTWEGLPELQGASQSFTMRAVFECKPDDESRKHLIWTRRAVSKADKYVFYK